MKKKMLYIMHIPWAWIKQRPQFLAEALNQYYAVDVIDYKGIAKYNVSSNTTNIHLLNIGRLPLGKNQLFNRLIQLYNFTRIKLFIAFNYKRYDYIWLTNVNLVRMLPKNVDKYCSLVYDHMDDYLEFETVKNNPKLAKKIGFYFDIALNKAKYIFCSSLMLRDSLVTSYPESISRVFTIFNALDENFINQPSKASLPTHIQKIFNELETKNLIMYIGTIDEWFDFELIKQSTAEISNITYILVGPNLSKYEASTNIILIGALDHHYMYLLMQHAQILIMPFKINKLIEAVDPVKVYEYIAMAKPVLLPRYKEVEKFTNFSNQIYYYSSPEEYIQNLKLIVQSIANKAHEIVLNKDFIQTNSWHARAIEIKMHLV